MFRKREQSEWESDYSGKGTMKNTEEKQERKMTAPLQSKTKNTILKGNKLIGDISVSCDLELSGEIEGNITSEQNSSIIIRGSCRGSVHTKEGSVDIHGELRDGNITAGSNVTITGKFDGGEVKAKGKISINGEFNGKLEASDIEIGAEARGTGEIFYKDSISIARGASIEGQLCKLPAELTLIKNPSEEIKEIKKPSAKQAGGA